jgi:hypothetical protein
MAPTSQARKLIGAFPLHPFLTLGILHLANLVLLATGCQVAKPVATGGSGNIANDLVEKAVATAIM